MFDIAWSEFLLIGAVALVAIPPKDLPKAMRTVGQMVGKMRRMAAEFQGQFQEAMREAELSDLKKQVEEVGGSVSSALNTQTPPSDFKPIEMPQETPAAPDAEALKQAEATLAALPAPEPLPPVEIAPAPIAEPAPEEPAASEAKPKRRRAAKAPAADAAPESEAAAPAADEPAPKPARRRKPKVDAADEGSAA